MSPEISRLLAVAGVNVLLEDDGYAQSSRSQNDIAHQKTALGHSLSGNRPGAARETSRYDDDTDYSDQGRHSADEYHDQMQKEIADKDEAGKSATALSDMINRRIRGLKGTVEKSKASYPQGAWIVKFSASSDDNTIRFSINVYPLQATGYRFKISSTDSGAGSTEPNVTFNKLSDLMETLIESITAMRGRESIPSSALWKFIREIGVKHGGKE